MVSRPLQPTLIVSQPTVPESVDAELRCYICMEQAGTESDGISPEFISVCKCSESGSMPICKQCFVTWLERELERQGELGTFRCMICKELYRLKLARKSARLMCYIVGERVLMYLYLSAFFSGCVTVAYIMVALTALFSGHLGTYRSLVGGPDQTIFRAAEIALLFSFVVGSISIVLTFLWHSFAPCRFQAGTRQRSVVTVFDLRSLARMDTHRGSANPLRRMTNWVTRSSQRVRVLPHHAQEMHPQRRHMLFGTWRRPQPPQQHEQPPQQPQPELPAGAARADAAPETQRQPEAR